MTHHQAFNIGIGFTVRPFLSTEPGDTSRGRQLNPNWTLLIEPVQHPLQVPFTTSRISSYTIKFDHHLQPYNVLAESNMSIAAFGSAEDRLMNHILLLGTYQGFNGQVIHEWIKTMSADEKGDNPSGYLAEWYSATWVVRVLHKLREKCPECHLDKIPSEKLHDRILRRFRAISATDYKDCAVEVKGRLITFGVLSS